MNRHPIHHQDRTHVHGLRHWLHDPRLWAALALIAVIALLIVAVMLAPNAGSRVYWRYPFIY